MSYNGYCGLGLYNGLVANVNWVQLMVLETMLFWVRIPASPPNLKCENDGIGSLDGLKTRCLNRRVGSNPTSRTKQFNLGRLV